MKHIDHLSLYYHPYCGYCSRVLYALQNLELEIDLKDIARNPDSLQELIDGTGRRTTPCLRITDPTTNQIKWMHESRDIIQYLEDLSDD